MSNLSPIKSESKAATVRLFYPEKGTTYSGRTDYKHCCSQQPLESIPDYLWAGIYPDLQPPILYYGFFLGMNELWDVIRTRLPNSVKSMRKSRRVPVEGNPDETAWVEETLPDASKTLRASSLTKDISSYLQIPDDFVRVALFAKTTGRFDYGLALGSNYVGILPDELHQGVREFFRIPEDVKPMWHLNPPNWYWNRLRTRTVTSMESTPAHASL